MNIYVIGQRGMGKSTLALFLARRIQSAVHAHVIPVFDPKRTYNSIPHTSDLDAFNDFLENPPGNAVAYQPFSQNAALDSKTSDEVYEAFTEFFDVLGIEYHLGVREDASRPNLAPVALIVDEAWFLQSGGTAHPRLQTLVRLADSEKFFLIQAAHRPTDFSPKVRAQADELYIFRQWLVDDLRVVAEWCGDDVAETVRNLPPHHVVKFVVSDRTWQVWNHPTGWYIPLKEQDSGKSLGSNEPSAKTGTSGDPSQP